MTVKLHLFVASAVDSSELATSGSGFFIIRQGTLGKRCVRGWMDSRTSVYTMLKTEPNPLSLPRTEHDICPEATQ
jgi:hypothetical protein